MQTASKTVLVTGAAGNVGQAILSRLARQGDRLVAIDRHAAGILDVLAGHGGAERHLVLADVDLLDAGSCDKAFAAAADRFGQLDGVVHTVGGFAMASAAETTPDLFQKMFSLNAVSTLNVFHAALPRLGQGGGSLVAIGAGAALKAGAGMAAYAASKSAVHRLVESFADELKSKGIRVNAILPSIIDTPQNRSAMPGADHTAWVRPEEIAETIAFLLGDAGSGVTGALIPVTGRV